MIVQKFIRFDNQPSCATVAAVGHGGRDIPPWGTVAAAPI
jgi:hypothetical protein